jgi:hypothetical protein
MYHSPARLYVADGAGLPAGRALSWLPVVPLPVLLEPVLVLVY